MPRIAVNGTVLHYESEGDGPPVVFAHGFLWSSAMYEAQVASLRDRYRCICFDFRGHGRSEVARSGYDLDTFTTDVASLIESLGCAPCHFVGHSMGGFVGLRLAIRHAALLRSLVLIDSSADAEPRETIGRYRLMKVVARAFGLRVVASRVMAIMFGREFLADAARAREREEWRRRLLSNDRHAAAACVEAILDREPVRDLLDRIDVPTLVIVGGDDTAIVPAKSEAMAGAIRGSRLVVLPHVGHTSPVEAPREVSELLGDFFDERNRRLPPSAVTN